MVQKNKTKKPKEVPPKKQQKVKTPKQAAAVTKLTSAAIASNMMEALKPTAKPTTAVEDELKAIVMQGATKEQLAEAYEMSKAASSVNNGNDYGNGYTPMQNPYAKQGQYNGMVAAPALHPYMQMPLPNRGFLSVPFGAMPGNGYPNTFPGFNQGPTRGQQP